MPTLQEIVVQAGGDPFDFNYIFGLEAALSQNWDNAPRNNDQAFAPPDPFIPEVEVRPTPNVPAPVTTRVGTIILEAFPWFSLLVPGAMGGAGTGDAPSESSSVAARGDPPRPPPKIDPIFEDFTPPDWNELSKGGNSSLLDPLNLLFFLPQVEMPPGEDFVEVTVPRVITNPNPTWWSFPDVGTDPESIPFPTGPGPGPAPAPISPPGIDPTPFTPDLEPFPEPSFKPQPSSPGDPSPDVLGFPLPDGFPDPIGDPITTPDVSPRPRVDDPIPIFDVPGVVGNPFAEPINTPRPTPGPSPNDFFQPIDAPEPTFTEFGPYPVIPKKDTCGCAKKKKPKKKKRPLRDVCYRGTYVQLLKGISYKKLEQVPCEAKRKSEKPTDAMGRPTKIPRKRKPRTPTWQDTINDVFGIP